jgi:hypothetical protein
MRSADSVFFLTTEIPDKIMCGMLMARAIIISPHWGSGAYICNGATIMSPLRGSRV